MTPTLPQYLSIGVATFCFALPWQFAQFALLTVVGGLELSAGYLPLALTLIRVAALDVVAFYSVLS